MRASAWAHSFFKKSFRSTASRICLSPPSTATASSSRRSGAPRSDRSLSTPSDTRSCLRITKKDRPPVESFTIPEAETLIRAIRADGGEAIGNYDEFRFFTGPRPSEQIALQVSAVDLAHGVLHVTKASALRRNKDRTKTGVDRDVELCTRALAILQRHLTLRADYVAANKIHHQPLFFHQDGSPIGDPKVTRRRWRAAAHGGGAEPARA
jgi:integrase